MGGHLLLMHQYPQAYPNESQVRVVRATDSLPRTDHLVGLVGTVVQYDPWGVGDTRHGDYLIFFKGTGSYWLPGALLAQEG